jgi:hypothetical protein
MLKGLNCPRGKEIKALNEVTTATNEIVIFREGVRFRDAPATFNSTSIERQTIQMWQAKLRRAKY